MTTLRVAIAFGAATLVPATASAHIVLVQPESRYSQDLIKDPPCGHPDNPPGVLPPTVYTAGETISVIVDEFVPHDGHLRIALAADDADLAPITAFDDFYNFPGVLMDDIEDPPGGQAFDIDVTLPDEPCPDCTLQVIQVMYDGNGFQESDLYYTCADIVIEPASAEDTGGSDSDDGGGDSDGGDSSDGGGDDTTGGGVDDGVDDDGVDDGADDGVDDGADDGVDDGGDGADGADGADDGADDGGSDGTGETEAGTGASDDEGGGCACASGRPRPAAWWSALVVLAVRRRR